MIKKTLYFGNPAYLSLRNGQLVIRLPEVEKAELPDIIKYCCPVKINRKFCISLFIGVAAVLLI